jgi:hypothetical protein
MADTETKAGAGTVPADEMDPYVGWTVQSEEAPTPLPSTGPQLFTPEQLPDQEAMDELGLSIPENQLTDDASVLDPVNQVRLGNTGYSSPLGVTANPEGAHIPGESAPPERIVAAPEQGQEEDLSGMTKAELEQYAADRGIEVSSSMTKAEMIEAIQGA